MSFYEQVQNMKAPDKIYLHGYPLRNGFTTLTDHKVENVEYIRKDALLEWAKETYLNESASAVRKVCFKQLIEKLESL